ncbi:aldehyde dehydrogenase family protein, partial [Pseudomonas asplenii]
QRCTTLRRLFVHNSVKAEVVARVKSAYGKVRIGDPREGNLIGPLIDQQSFNAMQNALTQARDEGGQ